MFEQGAARKWQREKKHEERNHSGPRDYSEAKENRDEGGQKRHSHCGGSPWQ